MMRSFWSKVTGSFRASVQPDMATTLTPSKPSVGPSQLEMDPSQPDVATMPIPSRLIVVPSQLDISQSLLPMDPSPTTQPADPETLKQIAEETWDMHVNHEVSFAGEDRWIAESVFYDPCIEHAPVSAESHSYNSDQKPLVNVAEPNFRVLLEDEKLKKRKASEDCFKEGGQERFPEKRWKNIDAGEAIATINKKNRDTERAYDHYGETRSFTIYDHYLQREGKAAVFPLSGGDFGSFSPLYKGSDEIEAKKAKNLAIGDSIANHMSQVHAGERIDSSSSESMDRQVNGIAVRDIPGENKKGRYSLRSFQRRDCAESTSTSAYQDGGDDRIAALEMQLSHVKRMLDLIGQWFDKELHRREVKLHRREEELRRREEALKRQEYLEEMLKIQKEYFGPT